MRKQGNPVVIRSHRLEHQHYTVHFRFIAIYNDELGRWHRYVTNLSTTMMKAR